MPRSITLRGVTAATPDGRVLFSDLDLTFPPHRSGLVGRNGVGKSTLLRLLIGDVRSLSGTVDRPDRIGTLAQQLRHPEGTTLADAFGASEAFDRLDRLANGLGTPEDAAEADWALPQRLASALARFGLPEIDSRRLISSLSGGQQTRLSLAAASFDAPDFLLLDEPTNNLDADGKSAVAELLASWKGGAIVVSHDRSLLREMDAIVELTTLGATTYGGNFDQYEILKSGELAVAERSLAAAERKVSEVDRRINAQAERKARSDARGRQTRKRNDLPRILLDARKDRAGRTAGGNAIQASRLRDEAREAAGAARAVVETIAPIGLTLSPTGLAGGTRVIDADHLTGGPDPTRPVINDLSLSLIGPERVALTGANGAGKSTLLRLLVGDLPAIAGSVRIGVAHAMLDQQVSLLDPNQSVLDNYLRLNPADDLTAGRTALARLRFRADAALAAVGQLSGGELLRAGLAVTIGAGTPPALLLLDEPTNHLDFESIEAVEAGLNAYDGALLVVSHDRDFLDAIGITREISL
jgi:ATPase subunit of ABC transporter with duplicated ATPase domains